jgi:hypothetical protein
LYPVASEDFNWSRGLLSQLQFRREERTHQRRFVAEINAADHLNLVAMAIREDR